MTEDEVITLIDKINEEDKMLEEFKVLQASYYSASKKLWGFFQDEIDEKIKFIENNPKNRDFWIKALADIVHRMPDFAGKVLLIKYIADKGFWQEIQDLEG